MVDFKETQTFGPQHWQRVPELGKHIVGTRVKRKGMCVRHLFLLPVSHLCYSSQTISFSMLNVLLLYVKMHK